jgi:lipoate-protein ligase A
MASKNLIESVLITGDFFIEPRNAIYDLEARLKWSRVEDLEDEIKTWFNSVKAIGITADNLIKIIEEAVR